MLPKIMRSYMYYVVIVSLFIFNNCFGLEYDRQRYNPNKDFLLHETNANPTPPKRDYVAPNTNFNFGNNKNVNNNDFPPLRSPSSSTQVPVRQSTKKPDDFPPLKSPTATSFPPNRNTLPGSTPSTSGKRDYVAPQFTTLKPTTGQTSMSTGKVKDLINFYDGKNNGQKIPSYSSIVQGPGNQGTSNKPISSTTKITQPVTQRTSTSHTPKPLSFSSIVAGSKPTSIGTTIKPSTSSHRPSTIPPNVRPSSPVLPSSIINNNNKNQGNNVNGPTDTELQTLSEELLRKDTNNAAKYITINYQEKTTGQSKEDKAPNPLLTITNAAWNIPTIQKFLPLLDNYERDTLVNEYVTPQERNEENAFMDAIMSTSVIRHLMTFFKDKGYVTPDPRQQRDFLKQLWFSLYSRGKGKISSSGFEHIFVSELKNGEVSGLHNWIYFSKEESANRVNYLGYLKYTQLNDKGTVLKLHFNQQGVDKPVDSMFIGTSPELEIALYTLCFVARADNDCKLKLAGKDVDIVTHTFRYRSKNLIGSAYPQI